jgi:hypothetical protein
MEKTVWTQNGYAIFSRGRLLNSAVRGAAVASDDELPVREPLQRC